MLCAHSTTEDYIRAERTLTIFTMMITVITDDGVTVFYVGVVVVVLSRRELKLTRNVGFENCIPSES